MRLIDADALMKELEREVALADDWKTAHEIANVVKYAPTISGWIRMNECSSCRYWDSKSGLSARMCKQFNGFTTQREFCSRWIPKEEE